MAPPDAHPTDPTRSAPGPAGSSPARSSTGTRWVRGLRTAPLPAAGAAGPSGTASGTAQAGGGSAGLAAPSARADGAGDAAAAVATGPQAPAGSPAAGVRGAAAQMRLVCFPHAGGAATAYAPLAQALPAEVEVLALQYPGRQERLGEPCLDSVDELVAAIVPELRPWLDGTVPFAFFGHSTGAIVAYEVARVLEPQGIVPQGLFASGRRGPSTHRDDHVHRGGDRSLLREVARLGGTPPELLADPDVQDMMLPALRGDYKAIETYVWRPGPPLACPIWALLGEDDPLATEAEAAAWRSQTSAGFQLHVLPGGHFYLVDHQPAVVALITHHLLDD